MQTKLYQPSKPSGKTVFLLLIACVVGSAICMALMWAKSEAENPFYSDAGEYVSGALSLYHEGFLGENGSPGPVVGREPSLAFILSLVMQFDQDFRAINMTCMANGSCGEKAAVSAQWLNRALFAMAGVVVCLTAFVLTGNLGAAVVSGGAIWLNKHMQKNMDYIISDPLALFLTCLFMLGMALALIYRKPVLWFVSGLLLAALILTKAIFFYFAILFIVIWTICLAIKSVWRRKGHLGLWASLFLFTVGSMTPSLLWMERNAQISGNYQLTQSRAGIAMNTREILNHMTPAQYFTSFLYWTRGFGDNWARAMLPKEIWDEFQIANEDGFYLKAQNGYPNMVQERARDLGITQSEAGKLVDRQLMKDILSNPIVHSLVTIPVMYRGLWVDQFLWVTLPCLIWLILACLKRRQFEMLIIISPCLFNILFYALVSLNIPRYQMTAVPALALALGLGYFALKERGTFERLLKRLARRRILKNEHIKSE